MRNASRQRDYLQQVSRVMDVDQWLRYFAVMALLANGEGGIANGIDDDYGIYRGRIDTRFQALPHDLDTILSIGEATSNPRHTLFDFVQSGSRLEPLVPFFRRPDIRERYFTILADLIETTFSDEEFSRLLNTHLKGWVPRSTIRRMEQFMAQRRAYAAKEIGRSIGRPPKRAAPTSRASFPSPVRGVVINEVLAANTSTHRHRGAFPDVIELYNPGAKPVSLAGMSLSDDPAAPGRYILPQGAEMGPGEFLLVYADDRTVDGEYHTGFALKQEGETLTLFSRLTNDGRRPVDSVVFGPQIADLSIGRTGRGHNVWTLTKPSIGSANPRTGVALGDVEGVRINEWRASPEARHSNDFIELANAGDRPVALGGAVLSTDYVRLREEHRLPSLSFISAKDYLLFETLGKTSVRRHPCDLPFRLPSHHGWIRLLGANGAEIDKVHYLCQRPDIAQGRLPNSSRTITDLTLPTPGTANGADGGSSAEVGRLLSGLRVSEIMYHPRDGDLEFIELTNTSSQPIDLEGVRFTSGIQFVFGRESLEPGACLVLVRNRRAFMAHAGEGIRIAGEFSGKLSNGGEIIQLSLPEPSNMAIQRFEYNDKWYASTDGAGRSLTVVDLEADVKRWNDLTNWRPSPAEHGTPGNL